MIEIIKKTYPDIRRTINTLQDNCIDGKLTGSSVYATEELFKKVLDLMLKQDLEGVREELKSNFVSYPELYDYLYNEAGEFKQPGVAIMKIA